jgi:hypothetical protein
VHALELLDEPEHVDCCHLSAHAQAGTEALETLCLHLLNQVMLLFVDSGSTHALLWILNMHVALEQNRAALHPCQFVSLTANVHRWCQISSGGCKVLNSILIWGIGTKEPTMAYFFFWTQGGQRPRWSFYRHGTNYRKVPFHHLP